MAANIDIRSLNAMFNDYLKNGGANESFTEYCSTNKGYFLGTTRNFNFNGFRKSKYVDTSKLTTDPGKYQSYIKFLLDNKNQIINDKAAAKTLMDLIEDLPMSAGLGLKEDEATQLYDNYLLKSEHKMKKMHPKTMFAAKKVGIPIVATVIVCALIGAAIATSGLVAGALPFLTDSLLLNIGSLATLGALAGAIIAPAAIIIKNAIVKSYYARKYGIKTNNLSQVLASNIQNVADIENLNLPISNLFEKFKKTEEKIKQNKHSKNPFKRIGNYFREKTNRNRAHAILDVLKMTNNEIAHTEDESSRNKLKIFQRYIVDQTKDLELSRKYADIFTRFRVDKKDKNKIADLKSNHAQEYRKLAISALTKPSVSSPETREEIVQGYTEEEQIRRTREQNQLISQSIGQQTQNPKPVREQQNQDKHRYDDRTTNLDQRWLQNAYNVNDFFARRENGRHNENQASLNPESQTSSDPIPTDFWKQYGDMTLGEALDGKDESQRDETTNANQTDRSYIHRPGQVLISKEDDEKYFKDWYKASQELGNRNGRSSTNKSPTNSTTPETPKTTSNKNSTQKDPEEVAKEWENVAKGIVNEINSRSAGAQETEKAKEEQGQQSKGETSSPKGTVSSESPIINRRITPEYEKARKRAEEARKVQKEKEEREAKPTSALQKTPTIHVRGSLKNALIDRSKRIKEAEEAKMRAEEEARKLQEEKDAQEARRKAAQKRAQETRRKNKEEKEKARQEAERKLAEDLARIQDDAQQNKSGQYSRKDVDNILNGEGNPPANNEGRKGKRVDVIDEDGNTTTFYPDNDQ